MTAHDASAGEAEIRCGSWGMIGTTSVCIRETTMPQKPRIATMALPDTDGVVFTVEDATGVDKETPRKKLQKEKIGRMCTVHIGRRTAQRGHCGQSRWKGSGLSDDRPDRSGRRVRVDAPVALPRPVVATGTTDPRPLGLPDPRAPGTRSFDEPQGTGRGFPPRHLHGQPSGGGARATRTGSNASPIRTAVWRARFEPRRPAWRACEPIVISTATVPNGYSRTGPRTRSRCSTICWCGSTGMSKRSRVEPGRGRSPTRTGRATSSTRRGPVRRRRPRGSDVRRVPARRHARPTATSGTGPTARNRCCRTTARTSPTRRSRRNRSTGPTDGSDRQDRAHAADAEDRSLRSDRQDGSSGVQ